MVIPLSARWHEYIKNSKKHDMTEHNTLAFYGVTNPQTRYSASSLVGAISIKIGRAQYGTVQYTTKHYSTD